MKKKFSTAHVLTAATGICLQTGAGIAQDVMDHLFPGIFTIGCAAMQPTAAKELIRQYPAIRSLGECEASAAGADRYLAKAKALFGETMEIDGPLNVSDQHISKAFADFTKGGAS